VLYRRWRGRPVGRVVLRSRPSGGGCKPPQAAAVKSRGGERCGKVAPLSAAGVDQEGERERTTADVSKGNDEIETGLAWMVRDEPGGYPSTAQVVSGVEVARAWSGLRCGTCEPVVVRPRAASGAVVACGRSWKGEPRAAETAKGLSTDARHRGGPPRGSDDAR